MTVTFLLPIGDWSSDGHGVCKDYAVSTCKTLNDVREAHFKIKEVLDVDIHKYANSYQDNFLTSDQCKKIISLGLDPNRYFNGNYETLSEEDFKDGEEFYIEADAMVLFWIDLLNLVDVSLNLVYEPSKMERLSFYGFDEKGRHIDFVGYGTLGD